MENKLYRHFKGSLYRIMCLAIREEDMTEVVVYKSVDNGQIWTRPKRDFFGFKEVEGETVRRFAEVDES